MTEQPRRILGLDIDMKLSVGNIIVIGTLAFTLVGGWFTLKGTTDQNTKDITKNTTRIERLETQNNESKDRLTRIEVTLQNMSIQLDRALRFLERDSIDRGQKN